MSDQPISIVVRQRVTHPRHLERFNGWYAERTAAVGRALPLAGVRRYSFEKDALFFYTFYDLRPGAKPGGELDAAVREVRDAWSGFGPDMRELTAVPYARTWERTGPDSDLASHPITIERLAFPAQYAAQEREWERWLEDDMLPDQMVRLPLASISRWRALAGEPRYWIHLHEYLDERRMRDSIANAEKPGTVTNFGSGSPSKFWAGWAKYMPYVDDLTRWIILPDDPTRGTARPPVAKEPAKAVAS